MYLKSERILGFEVPPEGSKEVIKRRVKLTNEERNLDLIFPRDFKNIIIPSKRKRGW